MELHLFERLASSDERRNGPHTLCKLVYEILVPSRNMEQQQANVIIVGAGIGGLAMAKTYLELSPLTEILVLEKVCYCIFMSWFSIQADRMVSCKPWAASGLRKIATRVSRRTTSMEHTSSPNSPLTLPSTMSSQIHMCPLLFCTSTLTTLRIIMTLSVAFDSARASSRWRSSIRAGV